MIRNIKLLSMLLLLTILSSCIYKMPNEDSYSLIPKTNNPTFIGTDQQGTIPNQASF